MSRSRPRTPPDVARELRRRSGFGCCRCGLPVVQYHHIVPWHLEEHFRAADMMTLCPYCHDAATKGAFNEAAQRKCQAEPHNVRTGYSSGALLVNQTYIAVAFGGTLLVGDGARITIDSVELFRLGVGPDGELALSVELRDSGGVTLAIIDQNKCVRCGDCLPACPTTAIRNGLMLGLDEHGLPGCTVPGPAAGTLVAAE